VQENPLQEQLERGWAEQPTRSESSGVRTGRDLFCWEPHGSLNRSSAHRVLTLGRSLRS